MSQIFSRHPRKVMAGGALLGSYIFYEQLNLPNPFYTPGVQNIEKRYSSGGGSKSHTPGAASTLGNHEEVEGNVEESKGIGSPHHQDKFGGQKPDPSSFDKIWNQAQYNSDKGK